MALGTREMTKAATYVEKQLLTLELSRASDLVIVQEKCWLARLSAAAATLVCEFFSFERGPASDAANPQHQRFLRQKLCCVLGKIGQHHARPRALDRLQRFQHHAVSIQPAVADGGLQHSVLP